MADTRVKDNHKNSTFSLGSSDKQYGIVPYIFSHTCSVSIDVVFLFYNHSSIFFLSSHFQLSYLIRIPRPTLHLPTLHSTLVLRDIKQQNPPHPQTPHRKYDLYQRLFHKLQKSTGSIQQLRMIILEQKSFWGTLPMICYSTINTIIFFSII